MNRPRPLYSQRATSTRSSGPDPSWPGTLWPRYPYKPGSRVVTCTHHRQICVTNTDHTTYKQIVERARLGSAGELHRPRVRSSLGPESSTAADSPLPLRVRCAAGRSSRTVYHGRPSAKARPVDPKHICWSMFLAIDQIAVTRPHVLVILQLVV